VLFPQPEGAPLLAGSSKRRSGDVCEPCCLVCCRSRYRLRDGPLQNANESARVTDVDFAKELVYVARRGAISAPLRLRADDLSYPCRYVDSGPFAGAGNTSGHRVIRVQDREWVYALDEVANAPMVRAAVLV